jgi:integrase
MAQVKKRVCTTLGKADPVTGERKPERREAWIVRYFDKNGIGKNGQKGTQHIETFARKKDALARADEIGVGIRNRTHIAPSQSITVAEACDRWLAASAAAGLEPTTVDFYRSHVEHHIKPMLGGTKLAELTSASVSSFCKMLQDAGRSKVMIGKLMVSLGSILAEAVTDGLATCNVVREQSRSRKRREHVAKRLKVKVEAGKDMPTPQEMKAIIDAAKPRWRILLLTAAMTGMRSSELRGLRWEDVDLKESTITVRQRADKYGVLGMPKNNKSKRTISLGPKLCTALKEWKLQSGGNEQVFPSEGDRVLSLNSLNRLGLIPAVIAAGLKNKNGKAKYTGLHALRHFHASMCLNPVSRGGLGLSPQETQARLGHSSIVITMDVYGHLFPKQDDGKAMAAAEAALLG